MIRLLIAIVTTFAVSSSTLTAGPTDSLVARQSHTPMQGQPAQAPAPVINLNTATKADLEKLPGVGPTLAQRILDYRQKNGAFKKVEELMNVQGIGEKAFLKLRTLVTVAPPKTTER